MTDPTSTTLAADPRTLNCPSWCQTDHAQERAGAVEQDAVAVRGQVRSAIRPAPQRPSTTVGTVCPVAR